jgi:ribonuclease J
VENLSCIPLKLQTLSDEDLGVRGYGSIVYAKTKLPANDIMIDGHGKGSEGQRILDDRRMMSNAGIMVITIKAYADSMRMMGDPLLLSRGLIYGSEQQSITQEAIQIAKKAYQEELDRGEKSIKNLKYAVSGALFRFFRKKLDREPMVMPIIVEV